MAGRAGRITALRPLLGERAHVEYVNAIMDVQRYINAALIEPDPAIARRNLSEAQAAIGRADTRLAAHAAPVT